MNDNGMKALRCAIGHGDMVRLQNRPEGGLFSLWLCERCGDLALHMELKGDIYWYKTAVLDRMGRRELNPPRPLPASQSDGFHQVKCDYCPVRFGCGCPDRDGPHMCMGCDNRAEDSKTQPQAREGDDLPW